MKKLNIVVIDKSLTCRENLVSVIESTGVAVVKRVLTGDLDVREFLQEDQYDVILLELDANDKSGMELLKKIKKIKPDIPVIIMSGKGNRKNSTFTLNALENGAMDFILKPCGEQENEENFKFARVHLRALFAQIQIKTSNIVNNIKNDKSEIKLKRQDKINTSKVLSNVKKENFKKFDLILIASSTGGPAALEKVFTGLSENLKLPILVVQHMPSSFTKAFAKTLSQKSHYNVEEGTEGYRLEPGKAFVAPGGKHMLLKAGDKGEMEIHLEQSEQVNWVMPAADVLFNSVASICRSKKILVVILTGMGSDGVKGVEELKKACTCYCVTQSEESCVVYGMPRSVYERGLSDEVSDIKDIAMRISELGQNGVEKYGD